MSSTVDLNKKRQEKAWKSGLLTSKDGTPKRTIANVMHVLTTHPAWAGTVAFDEFGQTTVTQNAPPMRPQDAPADYAPGDWSDDDTTRTAAWFASEIGFEPSPGMLDAAIQAVARKTIVHPVRDWLLSLAWDGTPRIDAFVGDYLGGSRSKYSAAVGRRWLISAVARAMIPGAKVDSMLVLEGVQGIGKSSALRLLAGAKWFADSGIAIGDKDSYQALRRKWIFELAELSSIRGREVERVKNFLSSQVDTYRASYGRRTQDYPRQVVFAGSTNDSEYLTDPTGARRFWPVRCAVIDLAAIERDRVQLWAEARAAYDAGEPWHLDTPDLRDLAAQEAAERAEEDPWETFIRRWLNDPIRAHRREEGITTADVLGGAIGMAAERITRGVTMRVGHVLRGMGYHRRQVRAADGSRAWMYFVTNYDPSGDAGDGSGDNSAAQGGSCHHVTTYQRDLYTHTRVDSSLSYRQPRGDDGDTVTTAEKGSVRVTTAQSVSSPAGDDGNRDAQREGGIS